MKINLTKKQYKELLILVSLGSYIRGAYADTVNENYDDNEMTDYLLKYAKSFKMENLVEVFHNTLLVSEELGEKINTMREKYEEDEFWHRLIVLLGQRDFFRDTSKKELEKIEQKDKLGMLPKKIRNYYAKYEKEFENHGINKLEIKK